jgi:hypothetical protein
MFKPIFGTGLARSGGGLYSMCLSTHPEMMVACCPNIELFRSFRNALLRDAPKLINGIALPVNAPLQDWYGTSSRIAALDYLLQDANLDVPFDQSEWPSFLQTSILRGNLETADLTKNYDQLKGATYYEILNNLLNIIANTRSSANRAWVGFHETWILDFFPVLARAFPDARFLVMFRDPRATVNSMLGIEKTNPTEVAQVLSYIRHWRKYAALAYRFSLDPLMKGRIHITAHDLVLTKTVDTLRSICTAFDLEFDPKMLDTENFYNFASGAIWSGNSSFESKTNGISAHRALRWRNHLNPLVLDAIEYLCGPDLQLVGYPIFTKFSNPAVNATPEITDFLLRDHAGPSNWRSDLQDPLRDLGLEGVRRQLLALKTPASSTDLLRKVFLFEETYHALRSKRTPLLPALADVL